MATINEVPLVFEHLAELDDGRIDLLFKKHVARITADCIDRPSDDSKRTVTLEIHATPILSKDDGICETVHVEIECKSKVPTYRSRKFEMRATKGQLLFFNRDFPEDLDQPSMFPDKEGDA